MMGSHARRVRMLLSVVVLIALVLLGACSGGDGGGTATGEDETGGGETKQAVADTEHSIETSISAADGGVVGTATHDGALVRVTFPADALAADTSIVIAPLSQAPGDDETVVDTGFLLEEAGTGTGPALSTPVWVEWLLPIETGDDVAMVSYNADGTYEVLPTRIVSANGRSAVLALATHFSPTGMRKVGTDAAGKAREKFSDFNWVVFVRGTQSGQNGPIRQTIALTLKATNTGGDIAGDYTGNATIKATNDAEMMGGTMTSPQTGTSDSVQITLTSIDPLASLTGPDPLASLTPEDDALAPLIPDPAATRQKLDEMPQWWGTGSITMGTVNMAGSASGWVGGYGGSGSTQNSSTLPVVMAVNGTQVALTVSGLPPGSMTFKGYVIGQGK